MNIFLFILLSYQRSILFSSVPSVGIGKLVRCEALQVLPPEISTQNYHSAKADGLSKVDIDLPTSFLGLIALGSFGAAVFQYSHPNDILFKGKEDYFLGLSVLITIWSSNINQIKSDKKEIKDQMASDKKEMQDRLDKLENRMDIAKNEMRVISTLTLVISVFALGMKSYGNGIFEKMLVDNFAGIFS